MHPLVMARRRFLAYFSGSGLATTLFPGALWAAFQQNKAPRVDADMIRCAEQIAGLSFTEAERELMLEDVNEVLESYETMRGFELQNRDVPAFRFDPVLPGMNFDRRQHPLSWSRIQIESLPDPREELAFWPVTHLAELLRTRQISSVDLTQLYLERLKRHDPQLLCVVTLTEELAWEQARRADHEIAAGRYRGPLHGIPWGAKDLLATGRYRTTWGAMPYKDQRIEEDATVVRRLEEAGAVLIAKLTLGALAWGDVWFGGVTKNPWNPEQGSSGSSAGPASATAAGLVAFALGSETWGSIVSPATRCGVTGLRPTFGRISRSGAMTLSWTMDKLGPICRSVEDCALVFNAVYGPDGEDNTVVDLPFNWDAELDPKSLRVGYVKGAFEAERDKENEEWRTLDLAVLEALKSLGIELIPIELPDESLESLSFILGAEAAAAFDDLTRSNRDDLMVRQVKNAWPNVFRQSRLIPAVEYIQANRIRMQVMEKMARLMETIDAYVVPSYGGNNLLMTNLTGHPCVVLPNGFTSGGTPTSISFIGKLFGEAPLLALAKAYQDANDFHRRHPPGF